MWLNFKRICFIYQLQQICKTEHSKSMYFSWICSKETRILITSFKHSTKKYPCAEMITVTQLGYMMLSFRFWVPRVPQHDHIRRHPHSDHVFTCKNILEVMAKCRNWQQLTRSETNHYILFLLSALFTINHNTLKRLKFNKGVFVIQQLTLYSLKNMCKKFEIELLWHLKIRLINQNNKSYLSHVWAFENVFVNSDTNMSMWYFRFLMNLFALILTRNAKSHVLRDKFLSLLINKYG